MWIPLRNTSNFLLNDKFHVCKISEKLNKKSSKRISIWEYPTLVRIYQLLYRFIVDGHNRQLAPEHINDLHWQIQFGTTLMQTHSQVTCPKYQWVILCWHPHQLTTYISPTLFFLFYLFTIIFFLWTFPCYY